MFVLGLLLASCGGGGCGGKRVVHCHSDADFNTDSYAHNYPCPL